MRQVVRQTVPHKKPATSSSNKGRPKWLSFRIQRLLKQKTAAWQQWKAKRDDPSLYAAYSKLRRLCKKDILLAKREEVETAFGDCTSIQDFWRTYRVLSNKSRKKLITLPAADDSSPPPPIDQVCEIISNQFYSVWNRESSSPPELVPERVDPLSCPSVAWVSSALSRLKPQKSTGGDGIPSLLLRQAADILAPSLCHIFGRSLLTGCVPSDWKDAIVAPIPKVTNPTCPGDFRPISLLPIASKVMEKHVLNLLLPYVVPLLPDFQFGFGKGRGTVDCLSYVTQQIGQLVDRHDKVACVLFRRQEGLRLLRPHHPPEEARRGVRRSPLRTRLAKVLPGKSFFSC